jgi:alkylation response protein AidB-like acyl-CoA dehydrogenase
MMVPDQDQLDFLASLESMLGRFDPLGTMPLETADRPFDPKLWRTLADTGALGLLAGPTSEQDPFTAALVAEALGRHATPVPFLSSAVLASAFVAELPRTSRTTELLAGIAEGTRVATVGLLAADGRLTTATSGVRADEMGGAWTLTGHLALVPDLDVADDVVVLAETSSGSAALTVAPGTSGAVREELVSLDRTQPLGSLRLDGAAAILLTEPGYAFDSALRAARLAGTSVLCAGLVGAMQRLLDMSAEYAKVRVQFGRPIGSRQAIKHKLADMLTRTESARSTAYHLADCLRDGPDAAQSAAALAKIVCSEAAMTCASDALQIHGGIGFTAEHRLHWYFKRCAAGATLLGDVAHHREALLSHLTPSTL